MDNVKTACVLQSSAHPTRNHVLIRRAIVCNVPRGLRPVVCLVFYVLCRLSSVVCGSQYEQDMVSGQQMRVSDNFFVEDDEDDFGYND